MTDIEIKMIKVELNKLAKQDEFSNIHECTLKLINLYEAIILGNQMEIEQLKKNTLVWHKVADGDYPPYDKCNCSINVFTNSGHIAYYNYDDECWIEVFSVIEINPPIAWCETPKYTEEQLCLRKKQRK